MQIGDRRDDKLALRLGFQRFELGGQGGFRLGRQQVGIVDHAPRQLGKLRLRGERRGKPRRCGREQQDKRAEHAAQFDVMSSVGAASAPSVTAL